MSFASHLIHSLLIHSTALVLDDDGVPVLDENGQPTVTASETAAKGLIQPKDVRELAAISQAGAAVSTHTIYLLPSADVSHADYIRFDVTPDDGRHYQVTGVRDAAGISHHLEVDARLIA